MGTDITKAVKDLAQSCNPDFLKYERWINRWNNDFFDDERFRAAYVIKLYEKRISDFYELLEDLGNSFYGPLVKRYIKQNGRVYSFGCGAGPEIVAYIAYVRNTLHSPQHLNIVGIDERDEWWRYIDLLGHFDKNSTIKFKHAFICNNYIRSMSNLSGVCIMSYPQSKDFEDIWNIIRRKFSLIIVLDQKRDDVFELPKSYGFESMDNGSKPYLYFIKQICAHSDGINGKCHKEISVKAECNHSLRMECHKSFKVNDILCKEMVTVRRKCGHKMKIECSKSSEVTDYQCDSCRDECGRCCGGAIVVLILIVVVLYYFLR